jgi:hypothetical protein
LLGTFGDGCAVIANSRHFFASSALIADAGCGVNTSAAKANTITATPIFCTNFLIAQNFDDTPSWELRAAEVRILDLKRVCDGFLRK